MPYISNHPYRILIIAGSGSDKISVLLNLIKHQRLDVTKIYLYVKNPFKSKYQLLIYGREKIGVKYEKILKVFIDYSQIIDNVYEEYNPSKKRKVLIVIYDMIADMKANKKSSPIVTELFIRGRKLNISLVFVSQFFLTCLKI